MNLIVAIGKNGEMGVNNDMPWGMAQKSDLAHFKAVTTGGVVVMGRNTYESIGRPLPGRCNIVVTSTATSEQFPGCMVVRSLDALLDILSKQEQAVYVMGGASIYKALIKHVDRMYITEIDAEFTDADCHFPMEELALFEIVEEESHRADEMNQYGYTFKTLRRFS